MKLYSYWRSSAAYRVRIALNLKGLDYETVPVDLAPAVRQQQGAPFAAVNPERRVPVLEDGATRLSQSSAIIEYLEERFPAPPLLPEDAAARATARSLAQLVACDIHPLNNVAVLAYLRDPLGADDAAVNRWYRHWVHRGFEALEARLAAAGSRFCCGDAPGMAELFLVPQVYNAERFHCDMSRFPAIARINAECLSLPAFDRARPERQPDAPANC